MKGGKGATWRARWWQKLLVIGWMLAGNDVSIAAETLVSVDNLRFWTAPDNTRLVFDISAQARYNVFTLDNPQRLVIDIYNARLKRPLIQPAANHPLFARVRSGLLNEQVLRIVFDVKNPVTPKSAIMPPNNVYGNRLIVDLFSAKPATNKPRVAMAPPTAAPAPQTVAKAAPAPARQAPPPQTPVTTPVALPASADSPKVATKSLAGTMRDVVVAIDAGHGGEDPGAHGPHGVNEKDVVYAIARKLYGMLRQYPGIRPVMVRDGDYYVGLRQRIDIARKARADLLVSIHADAFNDAQVQGASVFTLSRHGASSEAARWLANHENAADLVGGVSLDVKDDVLASVLLDLSQTATQEASLNVADKVLKRFAKIGPLHQRDVQKAGFVVLKSPDIPSILVETAFISNPTEEQKLTHPAHQQKIARAIYEGILDYFQQHAPAGTRIAAAQRAHPPQRAATVVAKNQHVIGPGETLSGIAQRYKVSMRSLKEANALADNDNVQVGQVLAIPTDS